MRLYSLIVHGKERTDRILLLTYFGYWLVLWESIIVGYDTLKDIEGYTISYNHASDGSYSGSFDSFYWVDTFYQMVY